ncbi:MAG: sulfotransferase [Proteobacteria bacterium]|nr:sulfotransferase [Pseudomonadota bacterium]
MQSDPTGTAGGATPADGHCPNDAQAWLAQGRDCVRRGDRAAAIVAFRAGLRLQPDHTDLMVELADALCVNGDSESAIPIMKKATSLAPDARDAWIGLGKAHIANADPKQAKPAFERALECDPSYTVARSALGNALRQLGDIDGAIACFRSCLGDRTVAPRAWFNLCNCKTLKFTARDMATLRLLHDDRSMSDADRVFVGYALSKALEDQGVYRAAFGILCETNRLARHRITWDGPKFSRQVAAVGDAFTGPFPPANDASIGREVVFLISMPRSGSTLTEQILSMHPQMEGAGELPDLDIVLTAETNRRRKDFPDWVADASAEDWRRLGDEYLSRTARWRSEKPISLDKSLQNWLLVGAAAMMLPGARFIDCRRDRVETCLACFRQLFAFGTYYSYDIDELARYWHDYDRLCRIWHQRLPDRFTTHSYEDLQLDPEAQTRRLLDFLGLPFDPACLDFHRSERAVRTFSAAQVREPLRRDTARAPRYGTTLNPLRAALARGDGI